MQTTLILLKPDAVQRGMMGRIISRFEDKGLQVVGAKMMRMPTQLAEQHYEAHRDKPFYPTLMRFMTSSPIMALAVSGKRAIESVRTMAGATTGYKADAGTIRGDFGSSQTFNLIHASDSPESAERELDLFFRADELCEYERVIDLWVVDMSSGEAQ